MGEAGRKRAKEFYDWGVIIPHYEALWILQSEIRKTQGAALKKLNHPWPARMDPFHSFAGYPTQILDEQTTLRLVDKDLESALERVCSYRKLDMVNFASVVLPEEVELKVILELASKGPQIALNLIESFSVQHKPFALRSLAWLAKVGILKTCT
jgi:hypothetical protein